MSDYGFQIRRLALTGADLTPAEVEFTSGLNVITGPSDTGKTFILQCIDYVLGARSHPDELSEAEAYETVVLELDAVSDGSRYVLKRALRGGDIALTRSSDGSTEQLRGQHAAGRIDTVSYFLLQLSGLSDKYIRTNNRGETRAISFRDVANLAIVSEQDVIRESSPLHASSGYQQTASRSVFRLLLSGIDDSAVVAVEESRISRVRVEAKTDVLKGMLDQLYDQIAEQPIEGDIGDLRDQLNRLDATYQSIEERLSESGAEMADIEERRLKAWSNLRETRGRLDVLVGLTERFSLLTKQYESDLRRLDAIAEAGSRLGDIGVEQCPVCGALPEHHDQEHLDNPGSDAVTESAAAEADRIRSLMGDLNATRQEVAAEHDELLSKQEQLQGELAEVTTTIQEELRPRAQESADKLRELASTRQQAQRYLELLERVQALEAQIQDVQNEEVASARQEFASLPTSTAGEFAQEVEARLAAWNFPDLERVTFSETEWDVVISGRSRASHGKGVRAVTHAAVTTGLLRYCANNEKPHPGFVLIDSPLVVYREPDPDEVALDTSVKAAFFADLESSFLAEQVILLENDEPPANISASDKVNIIRFTKRDEGRYGFIPRG